MKKLLLILCFLSSAAFAQTIYKTSTCISLPEIGNRSLAEKTFDVAGTSSSGAPVIFESRSLARCSVVGATVQLKSAGTCLLLAKSVLTPTHMAGQRAISFTITAVVAPPTWTAQEKFFAACGACPSTGKVETASCPGYSITSINGGECVDSQFCKWVKK